MTLVFNFDFSNTHTLWHCKYVRDTNSLFTHPRLGVLCFLSQNYQCKEQVPRWHTTHLEQTPITGTTRINGTGRWYYPHSETLICCLPGDSVNKLMPHEESDSTQSWKIIQRKRVKGELGWFYSFGLITADRVMNEPPEALSSKRHSLIFTSEAYLKKHSVVLHKNDQQDKQWLPIVSLARKKEYTTPTEKFREICTTQCIRTDLICILKYHIRDYLTYTHLF